MTGLSGAQPPQITLLAARPGRPRISGGRAPGVAFAPLTSLLILALATVSWPNDSLAQTTAPAPKPAGENTLPPLPRVAPVAPAQAAATIRAQQGFHLDLLAAEPLVMDPVAIEYDEDGRAWVVEMSDYPYTDKSTDKPFVERTTDLPLGRVRILEDVDGDGRFDRSDVFADQLSWPTGLAFWRGGVYVAATPDIWYLRDTDGDRRADERRRVFTGFRKFNVQAVMNNLKWGLDGRIYGAGSSNGGTIRHEQRPADPPLQLGRNDFCFTPVDERFTLVSGGARFGNAFDDWGQRFLCNIRNPLQHVVLPREYLQRHPYLPVRSPLHDAAAAGDTLPVYRISPVEPWRQVRARRWLAESGQTYPRSETQATGYFTSSSGVTIYRGAAYPAEFRGQAFLGEVAANAIHRLRVSADGVTFRAERADPGVEFVASTDNWFRPVNFVNAPDGTLHVVDMYREFIEHPWSIPDDIKAELDLESGRDRGRIYRLTPPGFVLPPAPRLSGSTAAELVGHLASPHSWWRETAQRLLIERRDPEAVEPLRTAAQHADSELTRLHALWTLQVLEQLEDSLRLAALRDRSPGIREHAVRLSEPHLASVPALRTAVVALAQDSAPRVRFQVACSLNTLTEPSEELRQVLALIGRRDAADPWIRVVLLSGDPSLAADLCERLWDDREFVAGPASVALLREAATMVGARNNPAEVDRMLALIGRTPGCMFESPVESSWLAREVVLGLGAGLRRSGQRLTSFAQSAKPGATQIVSLLRDAGHEALDETRSELDRLQAIPLLSYGEFGSARSAIETLLAARQSPAIQLAALRTLGDFSDPAVGPLVLTVYRGLTPAVRTEAVEVLLARAERHAALCDALESRLISLAQISATRRSQLLSHADAGLRSRAQALFSSAAPGPRAAALSRYQAALRLPARSTAGRSVFLRECASCHRLDGQGHEVGPNLETIRARIPDELLVNILDPNREVSPAFVEYVAELNDGRVLTGLVTADTPAGVVLRRAQGAEESVARPQLAALTGVGKSLMPEGLEEKLSLQEMADLLAYLRGN